MCAAALQLLVSFFLYTSIVSYITAFVKWPVAADRSHQGGNVASPEYVFQRVVYRSSWWRFGLCGVGCGWWCVERRWIKMTCITQQYAPIPPLHRHNVI